MMQMKRIIALLLCSVYLLATGGPAYASLSCKCVWEKTCPVSCAAHECCHDSIDHTGDAPAAVADVTAPCCGNHHSTEIKLYTGAPDADKSVRCAVLLLPPALAAEECLECIEAVVTCERVFERRTPFLSADRSAPTGLRAPPVLA